MRYFRWTQNGYPEESSKSNIWYIEKFRFVNIDQWDLKTGQYIKNWDKNTVALFSQKAELVDFPFTAFDIPLFSSKLRSIIETSDLVKIQYLPLRIVNEKSNYIVDGYYIANYLDVIDCLDRTKSTYELWTKENLMYWEEREWMLGTFRKVDKIILDTSKINNFSLFRLKGWESVVVIREDLMQRIEDAHISGCVFSELATT